MKPLPQGWLIVPWLKLASLRQGAARRGGEECPHNLGRLEKVTAAILKGYDQERLSSDVLGYFKRKGKGWQTRIDDASRKVAGLKR
jgi:hypothetical protein